MSQRIHDEAEAFLSAWFDVRRIIQTMNFNRFQQEGLSASQFILLNMIGEHGAAASPADLARRLNVDVTTTMRTADSLVARGLVLKKKDPGDRRRSLLALTAAGGRVHARMHGAFVDRVAGAFASMPPQLRSGLVEGLAAFVAATAAAEDRRGR